MADVRVYFDLDSIEGADIYAVEIWELSSPEGFGDLIDTIIPRAGADYVETEKATDSFKWFQLKIISSAGAVLLESTAVLAEATQVLIEKVRRDLKDTSLTPGFSDEELIEKIRMSALRHGKHRNPSDVKDNSWQIIALLVRIDCCYVLAYDFAKYLRLEIPGGASLGKEELYTHYLAVAKQLEDYYAKIRADLQDENTLDTESLTDIRVSKFQYDRD